MTAALRDDADACIRDLMGMVALPALWAGRDGPGILQVMTEAVRRLVAFDFCYIEAVVQADSPPFTQLQLRHGPATARPHAPWEAAARTWRAARVVDGRGFDADTPLGRARVTGLSLGFGACGGRAWFGARDTAFPTYHQLALLRTAASLAATGMQAARVSEEREQASRAKDEFLAMLAHELRNPLAPISAAAQLLALAEPDPARVRKASAVIGRQAGHMTALIDDLLDVSRVTRGLIVLEQAELDLARVVADAVEQVRPLIEARRHRLLLRLPDGPVIVNGDYKRLVQVLSNVLGNAAKYTPEGGRIELALVLETPAEGGRAVLSVGDNGVGMTLELTRRAFDLFAQAQRSPDRAQGGLGLGLSLVKSIVELHRGSVGARSAGPGQGSTFTIALPRSLPHAAQAAAPAPRARRAEGRQPGLRVMIVDDNVDAAQTLAYLLEALGHVVHVAHDADSALEAATRPGFGADVFLLDIGLPRIDGYELARRLRACPAARGALFVALTGYGAENDRARASAAGFDLHHVKPVGLDALNALLAGRRAQS